MLPEKIGVWLEKISILLKKKNKRVFVIESICTDCDRKESKTIDLNEAIEFIRWEVL